MEKELRKYDIVYADPPWDYRVWSDKGKGRSPDKHYQTQGLDYLKSMDVGAISNTNSVLLLWATFPCLQQAFELAQSWGFTYKTVAFTWIKQNRNNDNLFCGMGYYTRANAEIVLLFTKGKPLKRLSKGVRQVLVSRKGRHSEKPDEIRKRIVALFGDLPRVELFARQVDGDKGSNFQGWDVFGNEVENSIEIPITVKI